MAGQLNQSKKSNNRKLVIVFIGLIIIGIVCMKLKNTENLEEKQKEKNPLEVAFDRIKNQMPSIPGFKL
jgi:hypothetical protein